MSEMAIYTEYVLLGIIV